MLMEFKDGDRVHITKLNGVKTDFYATLGSYDEFRFLLTDCSRNLFNTFKVHKPNTEEYGLNGCSYYTLASDEEDTEEPVIQRTTDNVNHPSHYNYGDIEVIDYCDQVCKQYPSDLAPYVFNAIKYLSRSEYKNGKEDVAKAKFYIQRLFDKWDDSHE
ncbi:DUF3310 domain-containing protein [Mammaliicoccus sciuri]|uniref:DUF3310 domain-containing protein n=1 Tax=Mammaliicoccus sciuri TaxID=1296 RepID=UPI002DB8E368|nr:DUF3310 domain-containing protein [Mammaliicoccus sciuri]MEB5649024.1 DUF3310 domain-containing protein [Mammaliicoccus sciuri]